MYKFTMFVEIFNAIIPRLKCDDHKTVERPSFG